MKILFSVLSPSALRNFDGVVRLLAARGHEVVIVLHKQRHAAGTEALFEGLARDVGAVRILPVPVPSSAWAALAMDLRASLDLLYFFDERFHETYRARSWRRVPGVMRRVGQTRLVRLRAFRALLAAGLRLVHAAIPPDDALTDLLARERPDLVLFTPYVALRNEQPDLLRAARALGMPTAVSVASWDNLTSKSVMRPKPDWVFVWNATQRAEAVEIHGIAPTRVVVTGAQCFDHWLDWPLEDRREFLERVGLDPDERFFLYVCFTPFKDAVNDNEVEFVLRWIARLRQSDDAQLRRAGILIRPHPKRQHHWEGVDLSIHANVALWPRSGRLPTDEASKSDYHASIVHSEAVVCLNSTAMLEAALLRRPVLTILAPEFWDSQEGTLHFRYLLEVGGGLLTASRTLEENERQLSSILAGDAANAYNESFVEEFLRPHGLDRPATPIFVDELERVAAVAPGPRRRLTPLWALIRLLVRPLARRAAANG